MGLERKVDIDKVPCIESIEDGVRVLRRRVKPLERTDPIFTEEDVRRVEYWFNKYHKYDSDDMLIVPDGITPRIILEETRKGTEKGYNPMGIIVGMVYTLRKSKPKKDEYG